ncbi:TatD family hydrolase [Fodinicurvata halophila]|uniref:TatD family hydrolase n=1 Tax=Fodinicurvata halophila TaxID=1419723 RepID=A0ABV8ULQ5_9PROT
MLVDSHCHLDYLEREGTDLDEIVARARSNGVERLVTICTKLSEFDQVLGIARRFPELYCSVGVHPHEAGREGLEDAERLLELSQDPKVVGIGETGLDYYYENSPRQAQQVSFRAHISASRESGLPLIVHARDADEDTIAILREEYQSGPYPGVIHCFTAGPALAEAALEIGFYISLAGIITFKKADEIRETVRNVPMDRLLVETDSPFLAPVPKRGKRNEPSYVVHTAEKLADIKGVSPEEIAARTSENFDRLFSKAAREQADLSA